MNMIRGFHVSMVPLWMGKPPHRKKSKLVSSLDTTKIERLTCAHGKLDPAAVYSLSLPIARRGRCFD